MSKKLVIILSIVGFVLVAGLGAGFFVMWTKINQLSAATVQEAQEEDPAAAEAEANKLGPIMSLNPFVVNLADDGGSRYLRMTVELELSDELLREEVSTRLPQIRNAMLMILPSRTMAQINSTEGKEALRKEIIAALNEILTKGEIKNIFYTEFVVQ